MKVWEIRSFAERWKNAPADELQVPTLVLLAEIAAQLAQLNEGLKSISARGGLNVWTAPGN